MCASHSCCLTMNLCDTANATAVDRAAPTTEWCVSVPWRHILQLVLLNSSNNVEGFCATAVCMHMCRFQKTLALPAMKRGCHVITRQLLQQIPELSGFEVGMANFFSKR